MGNMMNFVPDTNDDDWFHLIEQVVLIGRNLMRDIDRLPYNESLVKMFFNLVMERAKIEAQKEHCDIADTVDWLTLEAFFVEAARRCGVDIVRLCNDVEAEEGKPLKYLRRLQAAGWFEDY